jgi:hypothetical protein
VLSGNVPSLVNTLIKRSAFKGQLGYSKQGRPVEAYFYPGKSEKKALIIGGVHGSELSAIELATEIIKMIERDPDIHYNLVIIPRLFPDNEMAAIQTPDGKKNKYNTGRYTHADAVDPNRQMPAPGKPFKIEEPFDIHGRTIEVENQLLLQLIHEYQPDRVINLHAIRDITHAGIFADPRTDHQGFALGYETDSSLAIVMAKLIYENGGNVAGNRLDSIPTTRYHNDPEIAPEGLFQNRNLAGSALPNERGIGVSLGTWASTAVCDDLQTALNRPAMRLITVEFPGYKRPVDYEDATDRLYYKNQIELYTTAIKNIFLSSSFEESISDPCSCKNKTAGEAKLLTNK